MRDVSEPEVRRLVREAVERALGPASGTVASDAPSRVPARPAPAPAALPATSAAPRRVAIGSDHGGFALKEILRRAIAEETDWEVHDCGTHSDDAVDYPDYAAAVAREVAGGRCALGVVVDAAGIGSAMAANKVPGARCAVCHDDATVLNSREHNDANILSLGARVVHRGAATRMVKLFLGTPFAGGRHERRVQKIMALERPGR
jgi:ribose 5-phosphate isomerase B